MRVSKVLRRSLSIVAVLAAATIAKAQDSPSSNLSLDPDEAVTVVYAVYGGVTNDQLRSHYVNVTDKVSDLLKKSPDGFSVTEEAVVGKNGPDLVKSLIIVYNYEQQSYFYNIAEGGGVVSEDKLRSWAKTHRDSKIGPPVGTPTGSDDFQIVFAGYGTGDKFINATEATRKLIRDQPDGFLANEDNMGGDPHPGWSKVLVIIFDDSSGRHLYSIYNVGPHVTKAAILDSAKSN